MKQSSTHPSLIYLLGGFTYLCQSKILWTVQVTPQVVTRSMLNFLRSLFDPTNDLDPEKKLVDLHMFDEASVCRKIPKKIGLSIQYCYIFLGQSIPVIINLELEKTRHSGKLLELSETFQGIISFQGGRRCKGRCFIIF